MPTSKGLPSSQAVASPLARDAPTTDQIGFTSLVLMPRKSRPKRSAPVIMRLLCSPYQDQIVVDDIVFGMFRLNLHAPDHFAQRRAHIRYNDRAMPVGLQIYKYFIEERVAQKVMRIQHQTWLSRGIDNDDPLLAGGMQLPQKWIVWRAFKFRQHWALVFNGKSDDIARIDWLSLIQHCDIVEVEKVQRADSLQFSHVRAHRPHVSCDKRAKIPLSKECDPFRSKPPVKKNRCRFCYRKEDYLVNFQQRCEPCRHAQGMSRKISLWNNLTEERDDKCRKGKRSNASEDGIRQQGEKHVDGNIAPEDRG
jgi:hypothetical protein